MAAPRSNNNGFSFTDPFSSSVRESSSEASSSVDTSSDSDSDSDLSGNLNSSDEDIVRDLNGLRPAPSPRGSTSAGLNTTPLRQNTPYNTPGWAPPTEWGPAAGAVRRSSNPYFARRTSVAANEARRHTEDNITPASPLYEDEAPDVVAPLSSFYEASGKPVHKKSVSFSDNDFQNHIRRGSASAFASHPPAERRGSLLNSFHAEQSARSRQDSVVDPLAPSMPKPSATPGHRRTSSGGMPANGIPSRKGSFPNIPRRMSSFNPFDSSFRAARRDSEIGPDDLSSPAARRWSFMRRKSSANTEATLVNDDGVTVPQRAHLRTQSTSALAGFNNPFSSTKETIPMNRRQSAPLVRRPSQFQRMMSVVGPEPNPIPKRYRSKSVSTLNFYLSSLENSNSTLPIFEDDVEAEKENIQEYLAGVERLQAAKTRKPWESHAFQGTYFFVVVLIVYFVFIGQPIWPGVGVLYYHWIREQGIASVGCLIFIGWAALQCFLPLCCFFEQEVDDPEKRDASETALIIPAYKAAGVLGETIEAALKIFPANQIYIINNGNSPEPLDNTAEVCAKYDVHHAWVPIGSKIVAEFVGIALTQHYKYIMLIDDDVHLPANLPLVTDRIQGQTKCIGYTIKSTGANGIKGTTIQQCQDMEYKSSGLSRTFSGRYGSATFPHGAIILWETKALTDLFNVHPGYTISEDWYFGHAARSCGMRIEFCSQVFVETETPPNFIKNGKSDRGGFGEMTVYKQRFGRWNYFYVYRVWEDSIYILLSWRLGWRELITKIFVLVEVYDSIMALLRPFVIVITAIAAWKLLLYLTVATMGMYILSFVIFNEVHLRRKNERISLKILPTYMFMKFFLLWVNTQSVYWGIWDYARFFKVRHARVIENGSALEAAYKVRLGSKLVPLDTQLGDGLAQVVEGEDEIQPVEEKPVFSFGGFGGFGGSSKSKAAEELDEKVNPLESASVKVKVMDESDEKVDPVAPAVDASKGKALEDFGAKVAPLKRVNSV